MESLLQLEVPGGGDEGGDEQQLKGQVLQHGHCPVGRSTDRWRQEELPADEEADAEDADGDRGEVRLAGHHLAGQIGVEANQAEGAGAGGLQVLDAGDVAQLGAEHVHRRGADEAAGQLLRHELRQVAEAQEEAQQVVEADEQSQRRGNLNLSDALNEGGAGNSGRRFHVGNHRAGHQRDDGEGADGGVLRGAQEGVDERRQEGGVQAVNGRNAGQQAVAHACSVMGRKKVEYA